MGRLLFPDAAKMAVRRETRSCRPLAEGGDDVILLTLGTEGEREGREHFHPIASLAFDRYLHPGEEGEWSAMWIYGPSGAGLWSHLRAVAPVPLGRPRASTSQLERLDKRQSELERDAADARPLVPDPVMTLDSLEGFPHGQGFWGGLRRALAWANVVNPAQLLFRTYTLRRGDRSERNFQRAYLALQWMQDVGFDGTQDADWVEAVGELRFHLLRNRSFFGRWLDHSDGRELVHNYDSHTREQLAKTSSWMQSAANEHSLRYQPIYRYTANGAPYPMGGVLYYDPRLGAQPDPGWWKVANPFDLPYNPHTHPKVQRLARENPDELIPLALYTYQTNLWLRPIIAADFFSPGNPSGRERSQHLMVLAKQWLVITTGPFSLERLPYRLVAWAANRKGFTWLVDKSSREGNEELRLALEADLYFDPFLRERLQKEADARVLNPLVKPGSVEERLAHIQYESLRAEDGAAVCRAVEGVRQEMAKKLRLPHGLAPEEERREVSRRLQAWHHKIRLSDYVAQPLVDLGTLRNLEQPLRRLQEVEPLDAVRLQNLLERLYGRLYFQQLTFPEGSGPEELSEVLELTHEVWKQVAADENRVERRRLALEHKARQKQEKDRAQGEKKQRQALQVFLKNSHKQLERTLEAGCGGEGGVPGELEAHLSLLEEVLSASFEEPSLRKVLDRETQRLRHDLDRLEVLLSTCARETDEPWVAESQRACVEQTRALRQELVHWRSANGAPGGH